MNLSAQQVQILDRMVDGKTSQEIASELDVSINTISAQLWRVKEKLGARTRTHTAVLYALSKR